MDYLYLTENFLALFLMIQMTVIYFYNIIIYNYL